MKICGIISEYNPFHNGHIYHIKQTRERFGATHIVAVMSGNFTQRGDVAITDKYKRTQAALNGGADLVIELPTIFALGSAEQFAFGGVSLLNSLGCVELLSFGSECGNIDLLKETAGAVHYALQSDEFLSYMRSGMPYPAALQKAIGIYYTDDITDALTTPNNTLGIEYIKALDNSGSFIEPVTIMRSGAAHDSKNEHYDNVVSASQLREMLEGKQDVSHLMPPVECDDFADIARLETAILAKLRTMSREEIRKAPNVLQGLENRIYDAARGARSLTELLMFIKTKRYTMARIRRIIMCCFLGITKSDLETPPAYVRILGMNGRGKEILSAMKCELPVDASFTALMKSGDAARHQALIEDRCDNIYALAFKKPLPCGMDYKAKPIIID